MTGIVGCVNAYKFKKTLPDCLAKFSSQIAKYQRIGTTGIHIHVNGCYFNTDEGDAHAARIFVVNKGFVIRGSNHFFSCTDLRFQRIAQYDNFTKFIEEFFDDFRTALLADMNREWRCKGFLGEPDFKQKKALKHV